MRVLMVHDAAIDGGYGAEAYVRRLVTGLRDVGDDVEVAAGAIRHNGLAKVRDGWDPAARQLVERLAQRFRPDVIHFHNIARELSASVLSAAVAVPAVMTVHDLRLLGAHEHRLAGARGVAERALSWQLRRSAVRRLAATIGVSDRVSEALRRAGFPAVCTVGVPAPDPTTAPTPAEQCRDLGVLARLARDKGIDVAVEAFLLATAGSMGGERIVIAGDGPEGDRLRTRYANEAGRVCFVGRLGEPDVSELLGRVRAVVVASQPRHRPEGSSLAVVEAAMHGRPVVASDDPAVAEVAAQLGNAIVVASGDVGGFAHQLRRILADDAMVAELGGRGGANAERLHSITAVTAATREVYRGALARTA